MKVAQRMAQKSATVPELWARCLLGHCYGLWFLCLPAYVRSVPSRVRALHTAYHVLREMENRKVVLPDEVGAHSLRVHTRLRSQPGYATGGTVRRERWRPVKVGG
jgi:hypothetical protein